MALEMLLHCSYISDRGRFAVDTREQAVIGRGKGTKGVEVASERGSLSVVWGGMTRPEAAVLRG